MHLHTTNAFHFFHSHFRLSFFHFSLHLSLSGSAVVCRIFWNRRRGDVTWLVMLSAQPFCRSVANHKTFPYCINAHRVIVALRSLAQQMHINIFALLLCGHAVCVFACNRQQIFVTNYIEWLWSEWSEWMNLISIPAQPTWRGFPPNNCCTQPQWPTSTEHQGIRVNKFNIHLCTEKFTCARADKNHHNYFGF